jgi:ABC-type uncharacterized transport system involved in gliding motility auxiliary subunit
MSQNTSSSRSERRTANLNLLVSTLVAIAIVFFLNYLGYTYWWRKDLSGTGYYDLSPKTISLLSQLKEPVRITTYLSNSRLQSEINTLLLEYKRVGGSKVVLDKIDSNIDIQRADEAKRKFKFDAAENLVIFEYKDQSKYLEDTKLADFDNESAVMSQSAPRLLAFKGEQQFTATIQALVEGKPAKVYFIVGHGERDINNPQNPAGLGLLLERIKRENMDAATLNLAATPDIPADAQALVIAGPQTAFVPTELQTLTNYLENKGKLVVLQDPGITTGLESILQKYGITLENNWIITKVSMLGTTGLAAMGIATDYASHPVVKALKGVNLQVAGARSVAVVPGVDAAVASKVTILAKTPDSSWGETNFVEKKKPVYEPNTGDKLGPLGLAALYDGGEIPGEGVSVTGARLLVVGSSTFLVNQNIDSISVDFFTGALNWLVKKDAPTGISAKTPREYALKLSPLTLSSVGWISSALIPFIALLVGIFVAISRRK